MPLRDLMMVLCVVTVWGASFTVIKLGLGDMPPMLMGALRFMLSAFPALLIVPRPKVALRWWLAYGLSVGVGQFALLFLAIRHGMPAGLASVTLQSQAFFTMALSALLLRERWQWSQVVALAIAGCGLYLLASGGSHSSQGADWWAFMLTLGAAAFWGLSNVVVRMAADSRGGEPFDLLGFIVWTSLIPPIPFAILSLWLDGTQQVADSLRQFSLASLGAVAYLAFGGTILGSGLFTALLTRHPPGRVAPYTLLVPVVGLCTAWLILGERLTPMQLQGCTLVLAGLVINTFGLRMIRAAGSVFVSGSRPNH
ncbi:MAG: EamA family transporter [Burkholderiaceae bacterium]